jgi:hypothetical protein
MAFFSLTGYRELLQRVNLSGQRDVSPRRLTGGDADLDLLTIQAGVFELERVFARRETYDLIIALLVRQSFARRADDSNVGAAES